MEKMTNYEELQWRGLIKDVAGEDIEDKINNESITFYWGTDPTADSLHIGHYSSLITAKRLMKMGHKPILLCGGATGRIGDPRPTSEREIMSIETINHNIEKIHQQIDKIFDGGAQLVNNYDWFKGYEYLDFLRDIGKYVNVNYMLAKDIIARRLETGITYAEFSYMLIQGYDFLNMYEKMGCTMQVEGSDQWGNITTGVDLIKKIKGVQVYAFTMPLILDATGKKFGKSEGNALWLDKDKTSSYELYQYLLNADDSKILEYLKVFTFLTPTEIIDLMTEHEKEPHLRKAQKKLAECIITDLHGEDEYKKAVQISEALFGGNLDGLTADDIIIGMKMVPSIKLNEDMKLIDLLVLKEICSSKREAREMLQSNAISINNEKYNAEDIIISRDMAIDGKVLVIRKGKKKQYIGIFE